LDKIVRIWIFLTDLDPRISNSKLRNPIRCWSRRPINYRFGKPQYCFHPVIILTVLICPWETLLNCSTRKVWLNVFHVLALYEKVYSFDRFVTSLMFLGGAPLSPETHDYIRVCLSLPLVQVRVTNRIIFAEFRIRTRIKVKIQDLSRIKMEPWKFIMDAWRLKMEACTVCSTSGRRFKSPWCGAGSGSALNRKLNPVPQ
jgi:hypothetical protein